jgi:hypothetical protein
VTFEKALKAAPGSSWTDYTTEHRPPNRRATDGRTRVRGSDMHIDSLARYEEPREPPSIVSELY